VEEKENVGQELKKITWRHLEDEDPFKDEKEVNDAINEKRENEIVDGKAKL
jgi:hypothetical protein